MSATMIALLCCVSPARASDVIGQILYYEVSKGDSLDEIARRFGLGFVELRAANSDIDPFSPKAGTNLLLPTAHIIPDAPRDGILVNLADQRLYLFESEAETIVSFPVAIGKCGWETPVGETTIVEKRLAPPWRPPASLRRENPNLPTIVPPGPNNPLGPHVLTLSWTGYLIHGTNNPSSIGRRASHGCIRLYPEDIAALFDKVEVGTTVRIVDQPVKIGWHDGYLILEVHPSQKQADQIDSLGTFTQEEFSDVEIAVLDRVDDQGDGLNWHLINISKQERWGIPMRVTQ